MTTDDQVEIREKIEQERRTTIQGIIVGELANRLQREHGYDSWRGFLLTRSLSPCDLLNALDLPGYRRLTGPICRNDIAYLRWAPLVNATAQIVFESRLCRATLPVDEECIGHLGNLLRGRCSVIQQGWQCRRAIDHVCGPFNAERPLAYLETTAILFDVPLVYRRLDGTVIVSVGTTSVDSIGDRGVPTLKEKPINVLYHQGYWFDVELL